MRTRHLINFSFYSQRLQSHVAERKHLTLNLSPSWVPWRISKGRRFVMYREVLDKVALAAENIVIYDLDENARPVRKYSENLLKDRGRYRLVLKDKKCSSFDELLYQPRFFLPFKPPIRGSIIFHCMAKNILWEEVLTYCFDPMFINNISTLCGKAAVQNARDHDTQEHIAVVLPSRGSGLESISLFAQKDIMLSIFDKVARLCVLSRRHSKMLQIYERVLVSRSRGQERPGQ